MPLDMPADVSAPPAAAVVAPARKSEPIHVDANGYHYVVSDNLWLSEAEVRSAIEGAKSPQEALQNLDAAYKRTPYFLIALRGETSNKLVAIKVFNGRLTAIDGADDVKGYFGGIWGFGGVMDRVDVERSDLIRAAANLEMYLARQGMRPKINLRPGAETGTTTLVVDQEEIPGAKPWSAGLSFGNLGSRYSSRYTAGASGAVRPGGGLELTANTTLGLPGMTADSAGARYQNAGAGFTLMTPLGVYGASVSGVSYKIGESSAPLYPSGDITTVGVTGTQLAYADETKRLSFTQGWTQVDNEVFVYPDIYQQENPPLTDQHYSYLSLGANYIQSFALLGQPANVVGSVTLQKGLSPHTGTFQTGGPAQPNTHFGLMQASVNYQQSLPYSMNLSASVSGQVADSTLPQNNQWVVGGFGNLTAWLPAVLVGDTGALGRVALNSPTWAWQGYGASASAFVEAGIVRLHYTPQNVPTTRSLGDAGISILANTPFGTSLSVGYAWPIYSRNVDREAIDRASRANVYFSLNQSF